MTKVRVLNPLALREALNLLRCHGPPKFLTMRPDIDHYIGPPSTGHHPWMHDPNYRRDRTDRDDQLQAHWNGQPGPFQCDRKPDPWPPLDHVGFRPTSVSTETLRRPPL